MTAAKRTLLLASVGAVSWIFVTPRGFRLAQITHFFLKTLVLVSGRRLIHGPRAPTWSFFLEYLVEIMKGRSPADSIQQLRERTSIAPPPPLPKYATKTTIELISNPSGAPILAHWIDAKNHGDRHPVILYLHGGGYALMSTESHQGMLAQLARAAAARVLSVDYRLAPEHPFPSGLEDAVTAYRHLVNTEGISPGRIVIAGDSAGGGLTSATLLKLRDLKEKPPAGAVLLSPWVDLTARFPSWDTNGGIDYLSRPHLVNPRAHLPQLYAAGESIMHPLISPLYADLHDLPPLLVQVGGAEALRDEGVAFAQKAQRAKVRVTLQEYAHMPHVFQMFSKFCPQAKDAIHAIGEFVNTVTQSATHRTPALEAVEQLTEADAAPLARL